MFLTAAHPAWQMSEHIRFTMTGISGEEVRKSHFRDQIKFGERVKRHTFATVPFLHKVMVKHLNRDD